MAGDIGIPAAGLPTADPRLAILARMFAGAGQPAQPNGGIPTTAAAPGGMTKQPGPAAGGPPLPTGAKPAQGTDTPAEGQPFPSEAEYDAKNPAAQEKPYVEPDLKHRLLEGIFAGMMNVGQRGSGNEVLNKYLDSISQGEQSNLTLPQRNAAAAHAAYMTAAEGAKAPLDIQNVQAELEERRATAALDRAKAAAGGGTANLQRAIIDDPKNPGTPRSVDFNPRSGQYIDPDTQAVIPGAKPWEKPAAAKSPQAVTIDGKPGFAVFEPGKGWADVNGNPIKGTVGPPPTFAETGLFETLNAVDPDTGAIVPATLDRRTRTIQGFGASGKKNLIPVPPGAEKEIGPALADAREADKRLNIMRENEKDALKGNQQAMLSIVANHIGMTLGAQKGARINQAVWNEAIESAPILARAEARFNKDGYLTGVTLTPDQVKQMVDLGQTVDEANWKKATDTFSQYGIPFKRPAGAGGAPKFSHTATNPKTGEKIGWDGTKWVPITGQR